jgi:hypothetical protein
LLVSIIKWGIALPVNFAKIDKMESDRITDIQKRFDKGEAIESAEIFQSSEINKLIQRGSTLYTSSFAQAIETMPASCLFHPRILIEICTACSCVKYPDVLKPYLDRNLVLPVLTTSLAQFPSNFAEMITQRPYISVQSYNFIRSSWYRSDWGEEKKDEEAVCPHCFSVQKNRILSKINNNADKTTSAYMKEYVEYCAFPILHPVSMLNFRLLNYIEEAVDNKNFSIIPNVTNYAVTCNTLRLSSMLNSMPQVASSDVINIKSELSKLDLENRSNEIDVKMNALQALGLDYNPKLSVPEYLDIILPRREKVNALVDNLLAGNNKDKVLSNINDQIWKINSELSSSKKIEMLTYSSDFVFDNAGVLFSLLVGGIIGYGYGSSIGCGVGSGLGSLGGYVGSKVAKKRLKLPKYPKKTAEWLKEKVENPQERILATALSKDIKAIQVWNIKRKLKSD